MGIRHYHIEKDAIQGDYHIKEKSIPYTKLQENTIEFYLPLLDITTRYGLPADSTGDKVSSTPCPILKRHIKEVKLRGRLENVPSDAVIRVRLYDASKDSDVDYLEWSGESGWKEKTVDISGVNDGDILQLRVTVTTASATSGATFDLLYAVLIIKIGIS